MNKRIIGINVILLLVIFFVLEVFSGYVLNSKRLKKSSLLYAVSVISQKIYNPTGTSEEYKRVLFLRQNGSENAYPAYLFDPQVHSINSLYWLGHPPNSLIVYCNEGSGLSEFQTNKLGFRRALNQNLQKPIDLVLIGDSYTEGACVNSPNDLASILGKNFNLLNLGMGGSGPLFQFSLIKELLRLSDLKGITLREGFDVVWIIFTGNDLRNLVEERTTKLSSYLNDDNHHQDYFHNLISKKFITSAMKSFHDSMLMMNTNIDHYYGETLVPGSIIEQSALGDFSEIVYQFDELVKSKGGKLNVLVLENHPLHNSRLMNKTQEMLFEECSRLQINCLRFDLSDPKNKTSERRHLNEAEYYRLAVEISDLLSSIK